MKLSEVFFSGNFQITMSTYITSTQQSIDPGIATILNALTRLKKREEETGAATLDHVLTTLRSTDQATLYHVLTTLRGTNQDPVERRPDLDQQHRIGEMPFNSNVKRQNNAEISQNW